MNPPVVPGLVVIVMGSPADAPHAARIAEAAAAFGIEVVTRIGSAHRTPEHVLGLLREYDAQARPVVFVTVAGRSNALSGFADPSVLAPVIACPPPGDPVDVWSSLRMPPGVGCATVLEPANAALMAAKVLAVADPGLASRVRAYQAAQRARILDADREVSP